MPLRLHDLLGRGFFPKELPPPFSTTGFANALAGSGVIPPTDFCSGDPKMSLSAKHNLVRTGGLRRLLGIPNPIQFYRLASHIVANWPSLLVQAEKSPYSMTLPVLSPNERAIMPEHELAERVAKRAELRAKGKFLIKADITRFFPSIYTHSIPWALMGKASAKSAHNSRALRGTWEDGLDTLTRSSNGQQTIGIPIGPDTSRLLAEVILGRVDSELADRHRSLRGIRYIDDYEFVTTSRSEAEIVLADLQHLLSEFELELNPTKTSVVDLPQEMEAAWTPSLRLFQFREGVGVGGQRNDLSAFFDRVFALFRKHPAEGLVKYALARLRVVDVEKENWAFVEDLLNQSILVEPACIPQVCDQIVHYKSKRFPIRRTLWTGTLNTIIQEQLPLGHASEAAWAMWLLKIINGKLQVRSARIVGKCNDSIAALMGMGLGSIGLADLAPLGQLDRFSSGRNLMSEHWLLCYEGNFRGWFKNGGVGILNGVQQFGFLARNSVSFFDINVTHPSPSRTLAPGVAGGGY